MADLLTHLSISDSVVGRLRETADYRDLPLELISIGNQCADLSQICDPRIAADLRADVLDFFRRTTRLPFLPDAFLEVGGMKSWLDKMFGYKDPSGTDGGAMTAYLRHSTNAIAHLVYGSEAGSADGDIGAETDQGYVLEPDELKSILSANVSSYLPHEHLDFVPDLAGFPDQPATYALESEAPVRVSAQLRVFVQVLAEDLASLEYEWASALDDGQSDSRSFCIRLGRLLHTIEDYWFHSNYCEISALASAGLRTLPKINEAASFDPAFDQMLGDLGDDPVTRVRARRLLARRLLTGAQPGGPPLLCTGSFDEIDSAHSLGRALDAVEAALVKPLRGVASEVGLPVVDLLLSRELRSSMACSRSEADYIKAQRRLVLDGAPQRSVERLLRDRKINRHAAEELQQALRLEREMEQRHRFLGGPGGFMIRGLAEMERTRAQDDREVSLVDREPLWESAVRQSCPSSERFRSHTLMAKDTAADGPFRTQAVQMARDTSILAADLVVHRLVTGLDPSVGIDWNRVLLASFFPASLGRDGGLDERLATQRSELPGQLLGPEAGSEQLANLRQSAVKDAVMRSYLSKVR